MNLEQLGKSELIALIKHIMQVQPDLEPLLEAALPGGDRDGAPVNPEAYRRQVSLAFSRGGDDWQAAQRVAADLGRVMDAGDEFLDMSDHAGAGSVYQAVLQGLVEHYEMLSDEDGYLQDVVDQCAEGLEDCLIAGEGDVAAREKYLQALFETYRFSIDQGCGWEAEAEDILLEYAVGEEKNTIAGWVQAAIPGIHSPFDEFQRQRYSDFLQELGADDLGDAAYLELCRKNGRWADVVERLLTLGRLDEALAEAGRAGDMELRYLAGVFNAQGHGRRLEPLLAGRIEETGDHRLMEWLKERHKARGELAEALVLAQRLLEQRPDLAGYRDVRDLSRRVGVWQASRPKLLAEWAAARRYDLLTDVHLDEGEIDLALKSVRQYARVFAFAEDRLMQVAQAAAETRPQASLEIYREQAERWVKARGRNNYRKACVHLARMQKLYRRMSQEAAWTDFMAGFREHHRGLSALQDELSNAGL